MRRWSATGLVLFLIAVSWFSCSAPRAADELVGAWHAGASVGDGYQERYLFRRDQTFTWYAKEGEAGRRAVAGTWAVTASGIQLSFQRALGADGPSQAEESQLLAWGPLEKEDPARSPYPLVTTFAGQRFWQVSPDTDLWPDPFTASAEISEDGALTAVKALVGTLGPSEKLSLDSPVTRDGLTYDVVHHYQEVADEDGGSHTATKDWYYVETTTGGVYRWETSDDSLEQLTSGEAP